MWESIEWDPQVVHCASDLIFHTDLLLAEENNKFIYLERLEC